MDTSSEESSSGSTGDVRSVEDYSGGFDGRLARLIQKKYPNNAEVMMKYFTTYGTKIYTILCENYPMKDLPRYVNYDVFVVDLCFQMISLFLDDVYSKLLAQKITKYTSKGSKQVPNPYTSKHIKVDFSFVLAIVIGLIDVGESGTFDNAADLKITMKVKRL